MVQTARKIASAFLCRRCTAPATHFAWVAADRAERMCASHAQDYVLHARITAG